MPHIWELLQGGILAYEGLQGNVLVIGVKVHWNAAGLRPLSLKAIVSQKRVILGVCFAFHLELLFFLGQVVKKGLLFLCIREKQA